MAHFVSQIRVSVLTLFASCALIGHAQAQTERLVPVPGTITAKVMPLALADPWLPTFRFGAEYRLNAAWGLEASYGVQVRGLGWGAQPSGNTQNRYHKLSAETRRYLSGTPFYAAVAGFVLQQRYEVGSGTAYQDGQQWAYSSAQVRRTVQGGLLKLGTVVPLFNDPHWRFDFAIGAGIRRVSVDYDMREAQPYQPMYELMDCQPKCGFAIDLGPRTTPGTTLRPAIALDFRLGYEFGR
jgi:hypothetical protein